MGKNAKRILERDAFNDSATKHLFDPPISQTSRPMFKPSSLDMPPMRPWRLGRCIWPI